MLKSWSISRLHTFEKCPKWAEIKWVMKIPEPERPLPPGKSEHANDRGSRIHLAAEDFVKGTGPMTAELATFESELYHLRDLYAAGQVSIEGEWAFDQDWRPTAWDTGWLRLKLDAAVYNTEADHAVVVDYKTGKKFGNEVKHAEQLQLYALSMFMRDDKLEYVDAELWYLDVDELTRLTFTRPQAMKFWPRFDQRGKAMTDATTFEAKPNIFNCKWCPYGPDGTGHCTKGVRQNQFPQPKKGR